jgi:(p)ppGpp synthase/HD superfamily hydrolase
MNIIERARIFATDRHAGQIRKGAAQEPYVTHPAEVAAFVANWGGSPEWIAAAWLHDTVEDCPPTSQAELEQLFGAEVAALVGELTDDKSLPKSERKALQVRNAAGKSSGAALIKIADKTCNIRSLRLSPPMDWSVARKIAYVEWACDVVAALPDLHGTALKVFNHEVRQTRDQLSDATF